MVDVYFSSNPDFFFKGGRGDKRGGEEKILEKNHFYSQHKQKKNQTNI